jgi:hypothetical protein
MEDPTSYRCKKKIKLSWHSGSNLRILSVKTFPIRNFLGMIVRPKQTFLQKLCSPDRRKEKKLVLQFLIVRDSQRMKHVLWEFEG